MSAKSLVVVFCMATTLFPLADSFSTQTSCATSVRSRIQSATATTRFSVSTDIRPEDTSSSTTESRSFESFDYNAHWYPVVWARDLPWNRPTKVTVFDTDYVVARIPQGDNNDETVVAMLDRCPHKSAALSEGRITSNGYFQCAYHGWTFDGTDGSCIEIPQVVTNKPGSSSSASLSLSARTCGTAVPALILQGMVWLFPGGNLEAALLAPPPPTIPEMDMPGFKTVNFVRDFPVDWPILLENILDPDHGLFAHGALGFDLYSASTDSPQNIQEEFTNNGKGWTITSRVAATEKLIALDQNRRGKTMKTRDMDQVPVATSTFTAPNHVVMARRNKKTGETSFLTAFWVCPVGTGRSRFMSVSSGKIPFSIPRWIMHVAINNFLDQDTYLLATQQGHVLNAEVEAIEITKSDEQWNPFRNSKVRKNTYAYQSPTERLSARLGNFWDATLNRAPHRIPTLLGMHRAGSLRSTPSREVVLDRNQQHLSICPDSQKVVYNCNRIQRAAFIASSLVTAIKAFILLTTTAVTPSASRWFNPAFVRAVLTPKVLLWTYGLSSIASFLAGKLRREFFFKYTEKLRDRDLENIPKVWLDK